MIHEDDLDRSILEHTNRFILTHTHEQCAGEVCTIHNRSDHHMRSFPQNWRGDRGIMERMCPHGVGHPDPDEYRILNGQDDGTHGCDGCCGTLPPLDEPEVPMEILEAKPFDAWWEKTPDESSTEMRFDILRVPSTSKRFYDMVDRHRALYHTNARFYHTVNQVGQTPGLTPEQAIEILIDALAGACQAFEDAINRKEP